MNERTIPVDAAHAERVVTDFCDHAGLPLPTTAAEVVNVLDHVGYAVSLGTLAEFIRKRYISDPGDCWDAVAVYCFMGALESRRRWKPTPNALHDAKKSAVRIQLEQIRAAGIDPPINDLDRLTIEDALLQLVQCDTFAIAEALQMMGFDQGVIGKVLAHLQSAGQRATREALYELLREKLAGFEE